MPRPRQLTQAEAGIKHGWRSGLEERIGASLETRAPGRWDFEAESFLWTPPSKARRYTPDFRIITDSGRYIYVETKGRWERADRLKMLAVVEQHPHIDFRMVFQNPNARISKVSRTTYAAWCDKHLGIPWAAKEIPDEWLEE